MLLWVKLSPVGSGTVGRAAPVPSGAWPARLSVWRFFFFLFLLCRFLLCLAGLCLPRLLLFVLVVGLLVAWVFPLGARCLAGLSAVPSSCRRLVSAPLAVAVAAPRGVGRSFPSACLLVSFSCRSRPLVGPCSPAVLGVLSLLVVALVPFSVGLSRLFVFFRPPCRLVWSVGAGLFASFPRRLALACRSLLAVSFLCFSAFLLVSLSLRLLFWLALRLSLLFVVAALCGPTNSYNYFSSAQTALKPRKKNLNMWGKKHKSRGTHS